MTTTCHTFLAGGVEELGLESLVGHEHHVVAGQLEGGDKPRPLHPGVEEGREGARTRVLGHLLQPLLCYGLRGDDEGGGTLQGLR